MKRFFGHHEAPRCNWPTRISDWLKVEKQLLWETTRVLHFPAPRSIFAELFPKVTLRNKPSGLPPVRLPPLSVRTSVCFVRVWRRVRSHLSLVQRDRFICVTFYNDKISFSFCWRTIVSVPPRLNSSAWLNSAAKFPQSPCALSLNYIVDQRREAERLIQFEKLVFHYFWSLCNNFFFLTT